MCSGKMGEGLVIYLSLADSAQAGRESQDRLVNCLGFERVPDHNKRGETLLAQGV